MPPLNFVESQAEANYTYLFYPLEELETKFDHYPPDNWGIASIWWDGNGHMTEGKGGISTDKPDREGRNHLIQEELIQSFGLLNDLSLIHISFASLRSSFVISCIRSNR